MKTHVKSMLKQARNSVSAASAHLRSHLGRPPRFSGAYQSRADALADVPKLEARGYDDPSVAEVSFPQMCERETWDYPVIHWLSRLLTPGARVLDAGGHMGTKHIAFADLLNLKQINWTVYDMPSIVAAARVRQAGGSVPADIAFVDSLDSLPETDVLLASGLLQYLDVSLADFVGRLPNSRSDIILNKVALRHGPAVFTLERLGNIRVPYQIRSWRTWDAELSALGYEVVDRWRIYELGHAIPTHPSLGTSESWGFVLRRASAA